MTQQIELRPRLYRDGTKLRGDREIWIEGVKWGHVEMRGHGCHGITFQFHDFEGEAINQLSKDGSPYRYSFESVDGKPGADSKWKGDMGDKRSNEERIIAKAQDLIAKGRLRNPADVAAERERNKNEYLADRTARHQRHQLIKDALVSALKRADLTNSEREGLTLGYKELFSDEVPA